MAQDVEHDGAISQDQLQTNLRFNEGLWRKLTAIKVKGNLTVSTHDDTTQVAVDSLILELDPDGTKTGPGGAQPFCRGDARIGGETKKVALFRKPA